MGMRKKMVQNLFLNDQFGNSEKKKGSKLYYQFGNMFHSQRGTRNKTVLNDQFGNNVIHLQVGTRNKTVLNDQFGNNAFHQQKGTVLNDQFGNNVFNLQIGSRRAMCSIYR